MRICFIMLLFATGLNGAQSLPEAPRSQPFVIGISPFLENSAKDEIYRGIVRLLVEGLPLNSTVTICDAFNLKTITQVTLPNARAFNSPKTRANQFAEPIRELKLFLAREHARPTNANLSFRGSIQVPQFLDFLGETLSSTNPSPAVLLVGSPLYEDAKEPGFSMIEGYFPSDGHLRASRERSIFGLSGDPGFPLMVHWLYQGDPWLNDLHREKVTRFWSLYLERRGGQLAGFSTDLPTVLQNFREPAAAPRMAKHWKLDPDQTKVEMLRVGRTVEVADWLTRDLAAGGAQRPPSVMVGPMKIGIRWKHNIDLDLYATPREEAETLFFQHTHSPEGYYYKDHRHSPGREFEFIEFETPVDVREVEASVNFYKGECPGGAHGEVRIEFDGRIYAAPFFVPASEGNLGRTGRSQQEFWTRIPVQQMLKLNQSSSGATASF